MQTKISSFKNDFENITKRLSKSKQTTNETLNSAQILQMYNKNQICIQKLRNKKLNINYNISIKDPETFIKEVIEPFNLLIKRKELKITILNEMKN